MKRFVKVATPAASLGRPAGFFAVILIPLSLALLLLVAGCGSSASGQLPTSGGAIWTAQTSGTTATLYGVSFADDAHGWAVGDNGTIVATVDGGMSWSKQRSGTRAKLNGVSFVDDAHGWAVGWGTNGNAAILVTSNGGVTWRRQASGLGAASCSTRSLS
ncbi:MAG: WD40/YVTN/BNR-like repeat-containing protein [Thermoleophilia bacterium]